MYRFYDEKEFRRLEKLAATVRSFTKAMRKQSGHATDADFHEFVSKLASAKIGACSQYAISHAQVRNLLAALIATEHDHAG